MPPADLSRFVDAQAKVYRQALAELEAGRKTSHWMWFVFPQIAGLGRSETARFYAIRDIAEARAYLADRLLGQRLRECTQAVLSWAGKHSAKAIFGGIDADKFRSSLTLFEAASDGDPLFAAALDSFYAGERDPETLGRLED